MRAKLPDKDGFVERDGVKLYYEIYGDGPQTMIFLPTWSIVHSRVYKAQIPYFSERFRCITFDGRGNGRSDRPEAVAAYALGEYVADALAVMDATEAGNAIVAGVSFGGMLTAIVAAHHPERVKAAILIGTAASIGPGFPYMTPQHFLTRQVTFDGWNKYNREHWLTDYPGFAAHFVQHIFTEPHSTKQIEDCLEWAADTTGAVLARTVEARLIPPPFDVSEAMYRKIRCPVLMIHGDSDNIQPYARAQLVAELTRAELVSPFRAAATIRSAAFRQNAIRWSTSSSIDGSASQLWRASQRRPHEKPRRHFISRRRSVSVMAAATSRSRRSCARSIPACMWIGWRRIRSHASSTRTANAFIR